MIVISEILSSSIIQLINDLMNKLDILSANMGMANVCSVPLEYIILRGRTILADQMEFLMSHISKTSPLFERYTSV